MAGPFKMKGSPMQRNFGIGSSPLEQKDKKPETVEVDSGTSRGNYTYENPYIAYSHKNVPKQDKTGAPVAGPAVYSPVSGLQVGGPSQKGVGGGTGINVRRTDAYMKGQGNAYRVVPHDPTDSDKSGLPDEFEGGMSSEIRNLGNDKKIVKKKKKSNKKMDYAKSQLTLKKK